MRKIWCSSIRERTARSRAAADSKLRPNGFSTIARAQGRSSAERRVRSPTRERWATAGSNTAGGTAR